MFGIFDSGVGGLSVVNLLKKRFAGAGFIYLGDTAHFPYGEKSKEGIQSYAFKNAEFLLNKGAKAIIIACHTASSLAADYLRKEFKNIPIYDVITPTINEINRSSIKRVGVIGTRATINSGIYNEKLKASSHIIIPQACPLLVSLIEEGWTSRPETISILKFYLNPLKEKRIDSVVLSCTHYSLLREQIGKILGPEVKLIDPAEVLVNSLELNKEISANEKKYLRQEIYVTDYPSKFKELSKIFLGKTVHVKKVNII